MVLRYFRVIKKVLNLNLHKSRTAHNIQDQSLKTLRKLWYFELLSVFTQIWLKFVDYVKFAVHCLRYRRITSKCRGENFVVEGHWRPNSNEGMKFEPCFILQSFFFMQYQLPSSSNILVATTQIFQLQTRYICGRPRASEMFDP